MSAVCLGAICSTGAASSALTGEIDSAGAFAGARSVSRYWIKTLERSGGRSLGRWVGTDLICQSGQAVERDDRGARDDASA